MNSKDVKIIDHVLKFNTGLSLKQLVGISKMPQTTVYRTLGNLVHEGILYKTNDRYYLGSVMLRWLNSDIGDKRYIDLIRPHLLNLANETGETVHLVQRQGKLAFYIDKVKGTGPITLASRVGSELKLYSTGAGRAILTLFSKEDLDEYLGTEVFEANTEKTITDPELLRAHIELFRKQGYATEIEQNEDHIQCIGVPIQINNIYLAVSITTTMLTQQARFKSLSKELLSCVSKIRQDLGPK